MPTVDVRLVDVVKTFGEAVAVDHINLEVQAGEFFTLLGPSGCGKTTTLRMIGGFEEPTSGLIELQGEDVTWLPPYKRNVNTVFQNYALFPHLTIYENVAFGLRRKVSATARSSAAWPEMLELVELPGFERRKPTQISGGQAQRVALARALINRPAVLLLDEPLGALDLKLRKQMQVELKRIQQEVGITFIYVTHDQEEAMTMSDRIAVMNHGPLRAAGRPREPVRATGDAVRGRLPGRQQPAAGDGRGNRRRPTRRSASRTTPASACPRGAGRRHGRTRRRPAREDPDARADRPGARRAQPAGAASSATRRTWACRTQYHDRDARRRRRSTVYEQNVERATRAELWAPGEEVRLTWSPDHTFAVRSRGGAPPPTPPVGVPARPAERPPDRPTGVRRRRSMIGGALASGRPSGSAAFLASTTGGGVAASPPSRDRGTRPRRRRRAGSASAGPRASAGRVGTRRRRASRPRPAPSRFAGWTGYMDIDEDDEHRTRPSRSSRPRPASRSTTRSRSTSNEEFFTARSGRHSRRPATRAGTSSS